MKKVVINRRFGGFGLSAKAFKRYCELKNKQCYIYSIEYLYYDDGECGTRYTKVDDLNTLNRRNFVASLKDLGEVTNRIPDEYYLSDFNIKRDDTYLVQVVDELGNAANGNYASLKVVEIPDDVEYEISDYDGIETIEEAHRSWY